MKIGVPKEIKNHEYRVGLTPGSVREYVAHGHDVVAETRCGAGIGADDDAYRAAGAVVLENSRLEAGYIYGGIPARKIKPLDAETRNFFISRTAANYVKYSGWFK